MVVADHSADDLFKDVPAGQNSATDIASYTISAKLDEVAHVVKGSGTLRWTNTSDKAVSEVYFHLYMNAFKNDRSVFLREKVGGFRGDGHPTTWGKIDLTTLRDTRGGFDLLAGADRHPSDREDETELRVPLSSVAPGEAVTLELAWETKLPTVLERTGYCDSFHLVAQWFPKLAVLEKNGTWAHFPFHHLSEFYADFGTYDVTLDVPSSYKVGATGPLISEKTEGGRRIERHVQNSVHDFAWSAWDQFQERTGTIDGVSVRVLSPPGYESVAARELQAMQFGLPHYASRYGAYPYKTLTLVHPPETCREAGGMEYPTLITTGGSWYTPEGVKAVESVTLHEFGHQYFYGILASNEHRWPFLDEGFNSFADVESAFAWNGEAGGGSGLGLSVSVNAIQSATGRHYVHAEPVAIGAKEFGSGSSYGSLVYGRTSGLLSTWRRTYGDNFIRAFGSYTRAYRFKHPTPDDFFSVIAERLGTESATNLRIGLFEKGWIDPAVDQLHTARKKSLSGIAEGGDGNALKGDKLEPAVFQSHIVLTRRGTLQLPIDVMIRYEDGTSEFRNWNTVEDKAVWDLETPKEIISVEVDPFRKITIDHSRENNELRTRGTNGKATRTLVGSSVAFQWILAWLTP